MHITCRREDQQLFERIGFHLDFDQSPDSPIIEMVDEEANYAHYDDMPTNRPYFGYNGAGGNYGQSSFACDGRRYAEVETGFDGGFVVVWDALKNRPTPKSLRAVRRYLHVRDKVQKMFEKLSQPATVEAAT
jgi:hypothetical protein